MRNRVFLLITLVAFASSCSFFTGSGSISHRDGAQVSAFKALVSRVTSSMALQLEADGVSHVQSLNLTSRARQYANAEAGKLVVGLRLSLWGRVKLMLGGTPTDPTLLLKAMPVVMTGAIGAMDEVGIKDKTAVAGKVMKSGMVSIAFEMASLPVSTLTTLNANMAASSIAGLAEAGVSSAEIADAVGAITSGAVAAMDEAGIPAEDMAAVAGAITSGAMSSLDELPLTADELISMNVVSSLIGGAVGALADAGLDATAAAEALTDIMTEAVNTLQDAGFDSPTELSAVVESVSTAAIENLDADLFAGSAVIEAMGAIASGIGAGCAELADAASLDSSALSDLLATASATIAEEAVTVAADFGVSESILAGTIAEDLLTGVDSGGANIDDFAATVTSSIETQDWSTDVSSAVADGAASAQTPDTTTDTTPDTPTDTTPPTVSAGVDMEAAGDVVLNGTATDDNLQYVVWSVVSGPGTVTFGAQADPMTAVSATTSGVYTIRLTAVDSAGNTASDEMTLTWLTIGTPSNVAIPSWGSGAQVTWDAVTTNAVMATQYRLYYSTTSTAPHLSNYTDVTPGTPATPSYTISSSAPSMSTATFVCVSVSAYHGPFLGNVSSPICRASSTIAPNATATTGSTQGSINLSWSALSGATSYFVYYSTANTTDLSTWTRVNGISSPYTITGLNAGVSYYVRLGVVLDTAGGALESIQSGASVATAKAGIPSIAYSNAALGVNQSVTITPTVLNTNGSSITSCTITPTLPTGLSINATTCVISGTPTVSLNATAYTVTASNAEGSSVANFTIEVTCASLFGGGDGSVSTPYVISTRAHLENIGNCPSTTAHYLQTNSIDLAGPVWTAMPILRGQYNGAGWLIDHLTITDASTVTGHLTGLFSQIAPTGSVINLNLTNVNVSGALMVGPMAGSLLGSINGCTVSGSLFLNSTATAPHYGGGMVGTIGSGGSLQYSSSSVVATINGTGSGPAYLGGLVGSITTGGTLAHAFASGNVTTASPYTSGTAYLGGLVAEATGGTITASYATGNAMLGTSGVNGTSMVGLIASLSAASVSNCYASGTYGTLGYVRYLYAGGLAGYVTSGAMISDSYSRAAISVASGYPVNGGNIGSLLGSVSGTVSVIGTYAAPAAFPSSISMGTLAGFSGSIIATGVSGSYFYIPSGTPTDSSGGVTQVSSSGMMTTQSTFTALNFTSPWRMPTSAPGGFLSPVLSWQCTDPYLGIACP